MCCGVVTVKMQAEKSVKITTRKQFEIMVEFMLKHSTIAKGMKFAEGWNVERTQYDKLWHELCQKLNSLGPPIREVAAWQKVWSDYKLKIKRKLAHNKKEINSTGGGTSKLTHLSSIEEQVINLLSFDRAVPRDAMVFGLDINMNRNVHSSVQAEKHNQQVEQHNEQDEQHNEQEEQHNEQEGQNNEPEGQHNEQEGQHNQQQQQMSTLKRRRNRNDDYKKELLLNQTKCMQKITELLEQNNKYLKRISDTKEKKFKLYEKERQKKEAEKEMKMEIMKLKKRKLEMEISKVQ